MIQVLLIVLLLMLIGAIPTWGGPLGYGFGGGAGVLLLVVIVLLLAGKS